MRWLWGLLGALLSPILALAVALHPRLRRGWRSRLGFPALHVEPGAVWIHAASLGEGALAAAFASALRAARPELGLLRTWTSDAAAGQRVGGEAPWDQDLAAPLDTPLFVGPWLDRVRPRLLVLVEAELWPWTLGACRARGIPVVVVAARVGPGQRRLLHHPGLWRSLTAGLRWFVPDAATAAVVGGEVMGELRAEVPRPAAVLRWEGAAVVAGSTWEGEEAALLDAWEALPAPRPPLVLAPRDPRRFEAVAAWLGVRWPGHRRRSRLGEPTRTPPGGAPLGADEVLLLDTLGELAGLYRPGVVAFVGGTFQAAVGGHGPVEPAAAGAVLLAGPERHANPAAWAGRVVVDAADPGEGLRAALAAALVCARGGSARGGVAVGSAGVGAVGEGAAEGGGAGVAEGAAMGAGVGGAVGGEAAAAAGAAMGGGARVGGGVAVGAAAAEGAAVGAAAAVGGGAAVGAAAAAAAAGAAVGAAAAVGTALGAAAVGEGVAVGGGAAVGAAAAEGAGVGAAAAAEGAAMGGGTRVGGGAAVGAAAAEGAAVGAAAAVGEGGAMGGGAAAASSPGSQGPAPRGHVAAAGAGVHVPILSVGAAPGPVARDLVAALHVELGAPVPAERPLRPWLAPLALGWAAGAAVQAALTRPRRAPVPVISVGGITAGGSGKSPVALAILEMAEERVPAVLVARGYRRGPGPAVRLGGPGLAPDRAGVGTDPTTDPATDLAADLATLLGDELAQAARRGHRVASAPDRLAGIAAAVARWGPVVAVLDDGFQHRRLARDLDIVVLDARHPTGGGLLPVGLGREGLGALSRADLVVSMHGPLPPAVRARLPAGRPVVEAHLRPSGWRRRGERLPPEALAGREVHVVVGVARPEGFLTTLRRLGCRPVAVEVHADHAPFDPPTVERLAALAERALLVTTEKDAARLPPGLGAWVLEVEVRWGEGEEGLRARVAAVLAPVADGQAVGA